MKIRYYQSYTDDFIESHDQFLKLPDDYEWISENPFYCAASGLTYLLGRIFAFFYCRYGLHIKIENREILEECQDTGFFLYGNHTQIIGDAFIPIHVVTPRREVQGVMCGEKDVYAGSVSTE